MGDTTEINTKVLSGEFSLGVVTNAYTEKSLYAQNGPFPQVLSHIFIKDKNKMQCTYLLFTTLTIEEISS